VNRYRFDLRIILGLGAIGFSLLAAGVLGLRAVAWGSATPRVIPESHRVVAEEGVGSITASYRVENHGAGDLAIRGIETGCGCSVASIERSVIPPGEAGTVLIKATVPPAGERTLNMVIRTDGSATRTLPFQLTVVGPASLPHVAGHTPAVQFGEIDEDSGPATLVINTREQSESKPWIGGVSTNVTGISVNGGLVEEQPSGEGILYRTYRYYLEFDELPGAGRIAGLVEFHDRQGRPIATKQVPLLGQVSAPVSSVPPILFASSDASVNPPKLNLQLTRSDSGGPFQAELVEGGEDLLIEPIEGDGRGPAFSVRPSATIGVQQGKLIFRRNVQGAERVEIPYLFRIGSSGESE
jgi:hypothetical protein